MIIMLSKKTTTLLKNVDSMTFSNIISEEKTYYYRIKSHTVAGDSDWSNTISVIIKNPWKEIGIEYIKIPSGNFEMGSIFGDDDEKPVHIISLNGFDMSSTEITQGQYMTVFNSNPSIFKGNDNFPVENVGWYDAVKFCNSLSDIVGLDLCYDESTWECDYTKNGFRLPTEAEWEYACRAGSKTKYHSGDSEDDLAIAGWYEKNSDSKTHPVGEKEPNAWGLYDMHGNVWEWCNDWYSTDYYSVSPEHNPVNKYGTHHILRGGNKSGVAINCRSSYRHRLRFSDKNNKDYREGDEGFRIVRISSYQN